MLFDDLNKKLGGNKKQEDWMRYKNGGGWKNKTAKVDDSAFVGENSIVWGIVSGNAQISVNARISGNAQISGNARISGNAQISGNAWTTPPPPPLYLQGTKHAASNAKYGYIQIGCELHKTEWWLKHVEECGKDNGYSEDQCKEPLSKGGKDKWENILPSCCKCNIEKSNKLNWKLNEN